MRDLVTSPDRRDEYRGRALWDDSTLAGRVAELAHERPDGVAVVAEAGLTTSSEPRGEPALDQSNRTK